jgi:hypothetical protein
MRTPPPLAVRWTIGDVSPWGFEALRLSLWGARQCFGPDARLVVCVNSVPLDRARALTGEVPPRVEWRDVTAELPEFLRRHLDEHFAEGVGWKFAPLRVAPDAYELALDNDCILWEQPPAIRQWLAGDRESAFVLAEDVRRMLGAFSDLCGPEPRNSGIRGLPPGFDLGAALADVLAEHPVELSSELDEQGLQVAVVTRSGRSLVGETGRDDGRENGQGEDVEAGVGIVRVDEVTICSPFPPHVPQLGRCGAHFVGLNARKLGFDYYGEAAERVRARHFDQHRELLRARVFV